MTQTFALGSCEEALRVGERLYRLSQQEYGSSHMKHLEVSSQYATLLLHNALYSEAAQILQVTIQKYTNLLGKEHNSTLSSNMLLAKV